MPSLRRCTMKRSCCTRLADIASATLGVERDEVAATLLGGAAFFLLFTGYFMLRPIRETMGIAGGVQNLKWLFTATFAATLLTLPLFGWLAARAPRNQVAIVTLLFFALNLVGFAAAMSWLPETKWVARSFYVWISVFNLLAVSVVWSLLADLFEVNEAKRVFAVIAAGASAGGLVGPLLGFALVRVVGHAGLTVLVSAMLIATVAMLQLLKRTRRSSTGRSLQGPPLSHAMGGSVFAGFALVLRSRFLMSIAVFVLLLASTTTFLYFDQARLVSLAYPDPESQTRVFASIDALVQLLAILTQLLFTGRLARTLGMVALLAGIPFLVAAGFAWLAIAPTFHVLAIVMIVRRAGEYAFIRPGREILFTLVPAEQKYKAKSFIDTVVYRGADALSGWVKAIIDGLLLQPAITALAGAVVALLWAATGVYASRQASVLPSDQRERA